MTGAEALAELIERIGAVRGGRLLIAGNELLEWPVDAVEAMQQQRLLTRSAPATSVECPGCERQCTMPVTVVPGSGAAARIFVVCDKRDDVNGVAIAPASLEQWQSSAEAVAELLAALLDVRPPSKGDGATGRWPIGLLRGTSNSSHATLVSDAGLAVEVAGHSVPVLDLIELHQGGIRVDRRALLRRVGAPAPGAGDVESAKERRARLRARVQAEQVKGTKAFLKVVAEEERISISRLKQLLAE